MLYGYKIAKEYSPIQVNYSTEYLNSWKSLLRKEREEDSLWKMLLRRCKCEKESRKANCQIHADWSSLGGEKDSDEEKKMPSFSRERGKPKKYMYPSLLPAEIRPWKTYDRLLPQRQFHSREPEIWREITSSVPSFLNSYLPHFTCRRYRKFSSLKTKTNVEIWLRLFASNRHMTQISCRRYRKRPNATWVNKLNWIRGKKKPGEREEKVGRYCFTLPAPLKSLHRLRNLI